MQSLTEYRQHQFTTPGLRIGADYVPGEGVHIRLWAPHGKNVQIEWQGETPEPLTPDAEGYFTGLFPARRAGDRYYFVDGETRFADPASRSQPDGIFGPSEVVERTDRPSEDWSGIPFDKWVIYEVHTGTFSKEGTFAGIIADLPRLKQLGITTIEIMPVSPFSGARNWGYDGVFPHAVQHTYGGPAGLKELVKACHAAGIAIILDVVYNHLGPEGNVLFACGPYASDMYKVPWGAALNFDSAGSEEVRRYFLQSAWQWLTEYGFDGLRLDAVQMIMDNSAIPFLEELSRLKIAAEAVVGRPLVLIGESDRNDSRLLAPPDENGLGLDGQWADDFHHCLHATLTGEKNGYYQDYGGIAQLASIYNRGVAFEGEYSPFHQRRHGRSYGHIERHRLIVETQNHDQTGNRMKGERLAMLVPREKVMLAAAALLLSPFTPFLFMGEEFGSTQPFYYFFDSDNQELLKAVREGRAAEWKSFGWNEDPPDPAAPDTFNACILHEKPEKTPQGVAMQDYYRELIALSKELRGREVHAGHDEHHRRVTLFYPSETNEMLVQLSFHPDPTPAELPGSPGWNCVLDSSGSPQASTLAPFAARVYRKATAA